MEMNESVLPRRAAPAYRTAPAMRFSQNAGDTQSCSPTQGSSETVSMPATRGDAAYITATTSEQTLGITTFERNVESETASDHEGDLTEDEYMEGGEQENGRGEGGSDDSPEPMQVGQEDIDQEAREEELRAWVDPLRSWLHDYRNQWKVLGRDEEQRKDVLWATQERFCQIMKLYGYKAQEEGCRVDEVLMVRDLDLAW